MGFLEAFQFRANTSTMCESMGGYSWFLGGALSTRFVGTSYRLIKASEETGRSLADECMETRLDRLTLERYRGTPMLLTGGARVKIANKDRYHAPNDWLKLSLYKLRIESSRSTSVDMPKSSRNQEVNGRIVVKTSLISSRRRTSVYPCRCSRVRKAHWLL